MSGATNSNLNQLLQWSIENSDSTRQADADANQPPRDPAKGLDPKLLASLLGGPSDADLMREAMNVITAGDESTLDSKLIAWDNLEQLVEQIDNANNLDGLKLWSPLLGQLSNEEAECRSYAAWVISTAVQNNVKCQEKLLGLGGVQQLLTLVLEDKAQNVRKKAANALSSEVRNFQPAFDELLEKLPPDFMPGSRRLDACDMEQVNSVVDALRSRAAAGQ